MTELEIIIKDLRKDMLPEETNKLDGQKAEFLKNLDTKYPGILKASFETAKPEPKPEPETENIDEIIDEFLDFLNDLLTDDDDETDEELEDDENETLEDGNETNDCGDCNLCEYIDDDEEEPEFDFERIEFHDPATIVFWTDGTKTVVKARHGDKFDKEKGLAMAIAKRVMGNTNKYYEVFEKHCFDEDETVSEEKLDSEGEPISKALEKFGIEPNKTDAGNEETFDLGNSSETETETVAKPDKEEKSKKQDLKKGKKQD